MRVDFNQSPLGPYSAAALAADWGPPLLWAALHDRVVIETPQGASGRVMRVAYPQGAVGPAQGGAQFVVPLPPSDELWLRYRVKFAEGFDFRRGGKLPGLNSGRGHYSGGNLPVNGDGWSARLVWTEGGQLNLYVYSVDIEGPWGEVRSLGPTAVARPGQWHTVIQQIRLNRPGQSDGLLAVWVDGQLGYSQDNRRWRSGEQGRIDSLFFSTFHGGQGADWAPRHDSHAEFDDFSVSRARLPDD